MILEKDVNRSTWVTSFQSKMIKVLSRMPIYVKITIEPNRCDIFFEDQGLSYAYFYNFDLPIETNVFNLRTWIIQNWCPKIVNKLISKRAPTSDEISVRMNLQKDNPEIDPFASIDETLEKVLFIEKVIPQKSTVVVTEENIMGIKTVFKLNYPISKFLSNYYNKWTVEKATEIFFKNAEFQYSKKSEWRNNGSKV